MRELDRIVAGAVALGGVALLAVGGVTIASATGASKVLHACEAKGSHDLHLGACKHGEKKVAWNRAGQRGPSDVYSISKPSPTGEPVSIPTDLSYTKVLSLKLPVGTYLATQSVEYVGGSGHSFCYLDGAHANTQGGGADADILTTADMSATVDDATSSDQGVVIVTKPTSLSLECSGSTGAGVQRATITALRVAHSHTPS